MINGENRCQCSFTSRPAAPQQERAYPASLQQKSAPLFASRRTRRKSGAGSAALLLFCLLGLSLLFALAVSKSDISASAAYALRTAAQPQGTDAENPDDEDLGRLHLIELPGMLTVFAPSDNPIAPLPMDRITVDDDLTVKVWAPAGTEVVSILDGTIKSVTEGGAEGGVVTVSHKGGYEVTFYGLRDIRVERGQPVLQRSVLGCTSGDVLRIRITKDGRPVDPTKFLGAAAKLFS